MAQVTGLPVVVQHQLQRRDHPCADSVAYIRSHLRILPLVSRHLSQNWNGFLADLDTAEYGVCSLRLSNCWVLAVK